MNIFKHFCILDWFIAHLSLFYSRNSCCKTLGSHFYPFSSIKKYNIFFCPLGLKRQERSTLPIIFVGDMKIHCICTWNCLSIVGLCSAFMELFARTDLLIWDNWSVLSRKAFHKAFPLFSKHFVLFATESTAEGILRSRRTLRKCRG